MTNVITPNGNAVSIATGTATETAGSDGFTGFGASPRTARVTGTMLAEASAMLNKALKGNRRAVEDVREAFSTSDFTLAAFAVIDKEMLEQYEEKPANWRQWCSTTTVRDFKPKTLLDIARGKVGLDPVPELTEYPAIDRKGHEVGQVQVGKFGNRYAIGFEAWINDEAIDEIGDIPRWFSEAATETEDIIAVSMLVNAAGVNTNFFKAANGNAPTALPLTLENLDTAIQAVRGRKNKNGRPITSPNLRLVIPPVAETQADRILGAHEIRTTDGDTTIVSSNYLSGSVVKVVEPMLEVVNQSAKASSTWFLVPDPASPRKSFSTAFLRGHEAPEIRVKADQGQRVGGGAIGAEEGSFEVDDIQYRVRHITGSGTGDPLPTYASTGA